MKGPRSYKVRVIQHGSIGGLLVHTAPGTLEASYYSVFLGLERPGSEGPRTV